MVRPGYRQTEAGPLPEDWECRKIGSFAQVCMCRRIFADQTSETGEVPFYKIGTFGKKADSFISRELFREYREKYPYPQKGDVLLSAAGTLGRTVVFSGEEAYFQDSNIVWLDVDEEQVDKGYLSHCLKAVRWSPSEGSTISRLYNGIITSTSIPLPPKKEQEAISAALSDMDGLINSLTQLISKKKLVKQGVMQELLTGRRRLPGFTGVWRRQTLGDLADCVRGVSYDGAGDLSPVENGETVRLLRANNIQNSRFAGADVQYVRRERVKDVQRLRQGDIMVCMANGSRALVGKSCYFPEDTGGRYTFGTFMSCIRKRAEEADMFYLFNLMNSDAYWAQIAVLFSGSSINNLRPGDLLAMEFPFPPAPEQAAIGRVLGDMDGELQCLEQKAEKYRSIRTGMTEALLTGRIRLTDGEGR